MANLLLIFKNQKIQNCSCKQKETNECVKLYAQLNLR